jgi:hypothetical protein
MCAESAARKGTCLLLVALSLGCSSEAGQQRLEGGQSEPAGPGDPEESAPPLFSGESYPTVVSVKHGSDGTEVDRSTWYEHGFRAGTNRMGRKDCSRHDLGLRFVVPTLERGQKVAYARLILPATAGGRLDSKVELRIVGLAADTVEPFQKLRPSAYPATHASVTWSTSRNWLEQHKGGDKRRCMSFRRFTTDISAVVNEILARPGWGLDQKTIGILIRDETPEGGENYLTVEDSTRHPAGCRGDQATKLELYPTVRSAFVGKELLGRVTDTSVTVNLHALVPVETFFEIGERSGGYTRTTPVRTYRAEAEIEPTIDGLEPDRRYYYRLRFRRLGANEFEAGPERTFHTQRARGQTFSFVLQADTHLQGMLRDNRRRGLATYKQTLLNALQNQPDFIIDLGDTFHTQYFAGRDAKDFGEAVHRHLDHRNFFDLIGHSAPLFLVVGNHEGEQGWRLDGTADNLAVWATNARKLLYPNPIPDGFYGGVTTEHPFVGQRETVYAFEWGDALFVALDPFWMTPKNPHPKRRSGEKADPWAWTLGKEQFDWLAATLAGSQARFKLVFSHHVTGGLEPRNPYGRGGVRAAKHAIGGEGSYEWGGEGVNGTWEFAARRPGWAKPVHDLMAEHDVAIFFHGHDHCFAKEDLDHIVYQSVPTPNDHTMSLGFCRKARFYEQGAVRRNPGFVRVRVAPTHVTVDYFRTVLDRPLEGPAFTYTVWDCNRNGVVDSEDIAEFPDIDANDNGRIDQCEQR